ncbi:MAG: acyl-ACP thioesterase [Spirochaetaceae bacterium]|jgi:acyl-ACP thioesterase|nr:acyl-ACP thioesterase [Spirochaetaceae bacterium]
MDIWQETFPLRFGSIDRSDRLTLAATFDFFQEVAISHAENLGVGREAMARTGQGWVLSRISVFLERRPRWGETITVRSWPRGWDRLFAVRDYDIRDASDTPVVRGRSNWLILDIEKRRPLRPQAVMDTLPLNEGLDALPGGAGALETRDALARAGERHARYSDIDYNGHVNNARYIQWIQDVTGPGLLEQADEMRLDINYLSEIKSGEAIELWTAPIPGPDAPFQSAAAYEGRRREGSQAVFRAELRVSGGLEGGTR